MKNLIDAHICQMGTKGYIRKFPSVVCSLCMGKQAVELKMSEDDIDKHNKELLERKRKCK